LIFGQIGHILLSVKAKPSLSISRSTEGGPTAPWKVDVPATVAGKRKRKFFESRRAAEIWAAVYLDQLKRVGIEGISSAMTGMTVREAIELYLESKEGSSLRHSETLKLYTDRIIEAWGPLSVPSITVFNIEKWLNRPNWGKRARWNALGYARAFFAWCIRRKLATENPAKDLAQEMRKPDSRKEILSPDEMKLLLRLTRRDTILRAFLCLGGFAGIRTAEIQKLDWHDLDFEGQKIHVRPDAIKRTRGGWKERYVKMEPAFLRHCPRQRSGAVVPWTVRVFGIRLRRLRVRMARVSRRIGAPWAERWAGDWPDNCLRHSFAFYHLAIREDAGATAYQMGHTSPVTLYREYARAVRRQEAQAWWAL
jgi:integrase